MKYVIFLAILILLIMAFAAPGPASGQVLYPATAYPAFTAVPLYEAYPAALPLPTFIPSPPPDFGSIGYDPMRVRNAYLHVVTSTRAAEEQIEPTPATTRARSYLQAPNIRIGHRQFIVASWKAE